MAIPNLGKDYKQKYNHNNYQDHHRNPNRHAPPHHQEQMEQRQESKRKVECCADPDPALNFSSSGLESRQKLDPDATSINYSVVDPDPDPHGSKTVGWNRNRIQIMN